MQRVHCEECVYFVEKVENSRFEPDELAGFCFRHPPIPIIDNGEYENLIPIVDYNHWCGDAIIDVEKVKALAAIKSSRVPEKILKPADSKEEE